MIHFSKARLRTGVSGSTGALVGFLAANADSVGSVHNLVWSLFPDLRGPDGKKDASARMLFRMSGPSIKEDIYLYSSVAPHDAHALWELETKPFAPEFAVGDQVEFSLRVNATIQRLGKTHDVVMDARSRGDTRHRDLIASEVIPRWLAPRFGRAGLELKSAQEDDARPLDLAQWEAPAAAGRLEGALTTPEGEAAPSSKGEFDVVVSGYAQHEFSHKSGMRIRIASADVKGRAKVTDPAALMQALAAGIGGGRAYGCGMLLVRKAGWGG